MAACCSHAKSEKFRRLAVTVAWTHGRDEKGEEGGHPVLRFGTDDVFVLCVMERSRGL
jgi:hypothetical protein